MWNVFVPLVIVWIGVSMMCLFCSFLWCVGSRLTTTPEVNLPGVLQILSSFVSGTNTCGNLFLRMEGHTKGALWILTNIPTALVSRLNMIQKSYLNFLPTLEALVLSGVFICCRVPDHRRPWLGYNHSSSQQTHGCVLQLYPQKHRAGSVQQNHPKSHWTGVMNKNEQNRFINSYPVHSSVIVNCKYILFCRSSLNWIITTNLQLLHFYSLFLLAQSQVVLLSFRAE